MHIHRKFLNVWDHVIHNQDKFSVIIFGPFNLVIEMPTGWVMGEAWPGKVRWD